MVLTDEVIIRTVKLMLYGVEELIMIKKINAVKNFNAGRKLRKPAVPTVNTNIPRLNVF